MNKGRPPTQRPPSEKKALSYVKDRRNDYGENDKASRKAIPRRKAVESRRNRHENNQLLASIPKLADAQADIVESTVRKDLSRMGGWKKFPDGSLREKIERQRDLATGRFMRKVSARLSKADTAS